MKKVTQIGWWAVIDGKKYGDYVQIKDSMTDNHSIKSAVEVIMQQMKYSIQKVVTGKDEVEVMKEEAEQRFHDRAGVKKGQ